MSQFLIAATGGPVRAGGLPYAPPSTPWPTCATCDGPMQFLARIPLSAAGGPFADRAGDLLVFQCANDPGLCDEWEPEAGGNAALVVLRPGAVPMPPPVPDPEGFENPIVLPEVELAAVADEPAGGWLGRLGGEPDWIQADETPACRCSRPMAFVASLEQHVTGGINFGGGGVGYGFACPACPAEARWLFQC